MSEKQQENIENQENSLVLAPLNIDLKNVGTVKRKRKLTIQKRRKFFAELCKDFNPSRAAAAIGVHRRAIDEMLERDEGFKAKYDEIEQAILDQTASVNIILSQSATREAFPDRKLLLESRHPLYKKNAEIQVNVQVNSIQASGELSNFVARLPGKE